jgi:hypothetical protein
LHRIREAMTDTDPTPLGGEGKTVESDETFYGRKPDAEDPWYFDNELGWRKKRVAWSEKIPIVTLVERGGKSRSVKAENVTAREIRRIVLQNADTKSALMTDEANAYRNIGKRFVSHESVNHSKDEYVRGDAHVNTAEGFFSIFKRGMVGVYHTRRAIKGAGGKRLTYRRTRSQAEETGAA